MTFHGTQTQVIEVAMDMPFRTLLLTVTSQIFDDRIVGAAGREK